MLKTGLFLIFLLNGILGSKDIDFKVQEPNTQYMYLVRHGERNKVDPDLVLSEGEKSAKNAPDYNEHNCPLTPVGVKQANTVAEYFHKLELDGPRVLYASPFKRTLQTAAPSSDLLGKPLNVCFGLRELSLSKGDLVSPTDSQLVKYLNEVGAKLEDTHIDKGKKHPPTNSDQFQGPMSGVMAKEVVERLGLLLEKIELENQNVAIFTHRPVVGFLAAMRLQKTIVNDKEFNFPITEGSVIALKKTAGEWSIDCEKSQTFSGKDFSTSFKSLDGDKEHFKNIFDRYLKEVPALNDHFNDWNK